MDQNAYSDFVNALASKERHTDVVPQRLFQHVIGQALYDQPFLDALKKGLFAGKENRSLSLLRKDYGIRAGQEDFASVNMDLVHGILGLRTESDELLRLVLDSLLRPNTCPVDRKKVVDEAGDALFYMTLLLRAVGATVDEAVEANAAKLRVRYPEGYNSTIAAGDKDRAAEAAAQETPFPLCHDGTEC